MISAASAKQLTKDSRYIKEEIFKQIQSIEVSIRLAAINGKSETWWRHICFGRRSNTDVLIREGVISELEEYGFKVNIITFEDTVSVRVLWE